MASLLTDTTCSAHSVVVAASSGAPYVLQKRTVSVCTDKIYDGTYIDQTVHVSIGGAAIFCPTEGVFLK